MASGNTVDNEEQDDADDKRPKRARARRSKLVSHLLPVAIPPAALVGIVHAVESRDKGCGEETGQNVADEAAHSVNGEDVEALVYAEEVLVLDGEEGAHRGQGSHERGDVHRHKTCGGRDADEAGNDAGAEAEDAEFLDEAVFQEDPGDASTACCEVGVDDDVDGPEGDYCKTSVFDQQMQTQNTYG